MKCPRCENGKTLAFFPVYGPNHTGPQPQVLELSCSACNGTQEVSDEMVEWINRGAEMRQERLSHGMTLRLEAERLGVSPTLLSAVEQGRKPESELSSMGGKHG